MRSTQMVNTAPEFSKHAHSLEGGGVGRSCWQVSLEMDRNFRGARKTGALTGIVITMLSLRGTLCYVLRCQGWGRGVSEKKIHRIWQKLAPSCLPSNNCNCYRLMSSWRRKWQPTPVLLPGESHGQRSLADYCLWGPKESDRTERLNHHHHCVLGMQSSQIRYNAHLIDRQRHSEVEWGILWQGNKPPIKPCWWHLRTCSWLD